MQFSLLSILGIQPQQLVATGAGISQEGQQDAGLVLGTEATVFSELLVDANTPNGDLQQGQQQASRDLVQELVANITAIQEDRQLILGESDPQAANVQTILDRNISAEDARELLRQFSDESGRERLPEALQEILEQIEVSGEPSTVQDILSHVAASRPEEITEQRANVLQRALQFLQQALTPSTSPVEALAAISAGTTFPEIKISTPERRKETQRTEEEAAAITPQSVHEISAQASNIISLATPLSLPEVAPSEPRIAQAVTIEQEAITEDALVLVATKQSTADAQARPSDKADVFEAVIADLSTSLSPEDFATDEVVSVIPTEADAASANSLGPQPHINNTELRTQEHVRIHHANLAYLHSEVADQVKVGVTQAVREGVDRITIQLNPHELGRVEVNLDIVADGLSYVSFFVEKQETIDLLQRDARSLERMLQEAGIHADAGSMEFNLRQESQSKEPWDEVATDTSGNDEVEASARSTNELSTSVYVHLVSDRVDIRA